MVDVAELVRPRALADDGPLRAAGVRARRVPARHRAPRRERRRPGAPCARSSTLLRALPGPVVLPLHPRTRARLEAAGWLEASSRELRVLPPLGYLAFTALLARARAVLTDSGGVQKEAYLAGVRCVTLRDTTEWVETVESGWNALVDLDADAALAALDRAAARRSARSSTATGRPARASCARSRRSRADASGVGPAEAPHRDRRPRRTRAASSTPRPSRIAAAPGRSAGASAAYSAWSAWTIAASTAPPSHG